MITFIKSVLKYYNFVNFQGFDTASLSLTWTLWLLGTHQEIQEKAYEEVISEIEGDIEFEEARKLAYIECIIKVPNTTYTCILILVYFFNNLKICLRLQKKHDGISD